MLSTTPSIGTVPRQWQCPFLSNGLSCLRACVRMYTAAVYSHLSAFQPLGRSKSRESEREGKKKADLRVFVADIGRMRFQYSGGLLS